MEDTKWLDEPVGEDAKPMAPAAMAVAERLLEAAASAHAIPPAKAATLRSVLRNVREAVDNALRLLEESDTAAGREASAVSAGLVQPNADRGVPAAIPMSMTTVSMPGDRVLEGVFDGVGMVGDDGKTYAVPPNYASKSKLVEGDLLKLTIGERGNFIYKQIGPCDRQRIVGTLAYDQAVGQFMVMGSGRSWRVLKASVTFYRGEAGDEAVILVPKNAPSKWAAVENVIKKNPLHAAAQATQHAFDR